VITNNANKPLANNANMKTNNANKKRSGAELSSFALNSHY